MEILGNKSNLAWNCRDLLQGGIFMIKKELHGLLVMGAAAVISV